MKAINTISFGLMRDGIYLNNQHATLCSGLISKSGGTSTSHKPCDLFRAARVETGNPAGE